MNCIDDLPTYSRYEVRLLCYEELYMMGYEEAMRYTPCATLRDAIAKYREMAETYDNPSLWKVSLVGVTYGMGGYESVTTLADTESPDRFKISLPMSEVC